MASDLRMPAESDNESMADYADGVGDGKFYFHHCWTPCIELLFYKTPDLWFDE